MVRISPVTRTGGFDADTPSLPRRFFGCGGKRLAHASPTVSGVDDERGDSTPGGDLMSDRNKGDGYEPEEDMAAVVDGALSSF